MVYFPSFLITSLFAKAFSSSRPPIVHTSLTATLHFFFACRWMAAASPAEKDAMISAVAASEKAGLHLWLESRAFSEFPEALKRATSAFVDRKVVLDMSR